MKKSILITMLFALFAVASWGQEEQTMPVGVEYHTSSNVDNPEYVYTLKNGWFRRMTPYTSPTETLANVGLFAFFEDGAPTRNAVKIYSVTNKKWLSYEAAYSYDEEYENFVQLVDDIAQANFWQIMPARPTEVAFDVSYKIRPFLKGSTSAPKRFLNWPGGKNNYPNDDHSKTAGLSSYISEDPLGGYWLCRLVGGSAAGSEVDASFFEDIRKETLDWLNAISISIGESFGMYYYTDEAALDVAKANLIAAEAAKDVFAIMEAAQKCRRLVLVRGMKEGGYYRFKNTVNNSYWGMIMGDENKPMQFRQYGVIPGTDIEHNPLVIWKYEKGEDGQMYLRNLYTGLYSKQLTTASSSIQPAATSVAIEKTQPFRCTLVTPGTDNTLPIVNAYLNSNRVAALSISGEIRIVHALTNESYFYVEEVGGVESEASLQAMCVKWYTEHKGDSNIPEIYKNLPKLPLKSENADTIFYCLNTDLSAEKINQYIDDVNIEGDVTYDKIIKKFVAIIMGEVEVGEYYDEVNYGKGAPIIDDEVIYRVPDAEYATICVPAGWDCPSGVTRFYCTGINNATAKFTLDSTSTITDYAGVPFLIRISPEHRGKKWQFVQYANDGKYPTITKGSVVLAQDNSKNWLTGILDCEEVMNAETGNPKKQYKVPAGKGIYVLARRGSTGKIGFSLVTETATNVKLDQYKCYLTIPEESDAAGSRHSFLSIALSDVETGIDDVLDITQDDVLDENQYNGKIYNMSGQRLNRMQKGLNIVNGKVVIKN